MNSGKLFTLCAIWIVCVFEFVTGLAFDVVSTRVGGTALLPCAVVYPGLTIPPHVIEWSRSGNSVPVYIKIGRYPAHVNGHFKGRMSLKLPNATLWIRNVTLSDEGSYECRVLFLNNPVSDKKEEMVNGTWVKLIVTAEPTIRSAPPPSITAREDESLILRCRIDGKPKPDITWRKDGWLIKDGQDRIHIDGGELEISALTKSDRGHYECQGYNSEGQVQHTTVVYIKASPELTVLPKNLTVKEDLDAFFNCKATGYPSQMTYRWFYNGIDVYKVPSLDKRYNTMKDGTFVIYNVGREDAGRVTCEASNGYGDPPKASAYLIVQYRARVVAVPSIVYGGLSLSKYIECKVDAVPSVNTMTWKKDGKFLLMDQTNAEKSKSRRIHVSRNGSLLIKNIQNSDEGDYTCTPYNSLGTSGESAKVKFVVKPPPIFTLRPKQEFEVEIGKSLTTFCAGRGDPTPKVFWRKVRHPSNSFPDERVFWHGGNLTISSIHKNDHGLWQCVVSNQVSEITSDVRIYVKYTTPRAVTHFRVLTSFTNATFSWLPGYDGGYPQHFMIWYKKADQGDHAWSTSYVEDIHKMIIVNRLMPDTAYQFAVLPENYLGSGPFSKTITKKTKTFPTSPPPRNHNYVDPPRDLSYNVTKDGIIVLFWKMPVNSNEESLLGYLVEYRRVSITDTSLPLKNSETFLPPVRQQRSLSNENSPGIYTPTKIENIGRNMSLPIADSLNILSEENWKIIDKCPKNRTTSNLKSNQLHRDQLYEFRVLAVTSLAYSSPSKSILIDTSGRMVYSVSPSKSMNPLSAGVLSGVISGIIFVFIAIAFVSCYCWQKRKNEGQCHEINESDMLKEKSINNLLTNQKEGVETQDSSHLSSNVAAENDVEVTATKKSGVLHKIKTRFDRTNNETQKKPLLRRKVKRTQSLQHDTRTKTIAPIYRSSDGKFRLSESNDESAMKECLNYSRSSSSVDLDREEVVEISTAKEINERVRRPVSDSLIYKDYNYTKHSRASFRASQPRCDIILEEGDENEVTFEIDCSHQDVEVRCVGNTSSSLRSSRPSSLFRDPKSLNQRPFSVSFDKTRNFQAKSHQTHSSFPQNLKSRSRNSYHAPTSSSAFVPRAEYVYLRDLGLSCPDTPNSDVFDQRPLSPALNVMPSPNSVSIDPLKSNHHPHSVVLGGHFHVTQSFTEGTTKPFTSVHSQQRHSQCGYRTTSLQDNAPSMGDVRENWQSSSNGSWRNSINHGKRQITRVNQPDKFDTKKHHSLTLPTAYEMQNRVRNKVHKLNTDHHQYPLRNPEEQLNKNNNASVSLSESLSFSTFKPHTSSLPSLVQRKSQLRQELRKYSAKRSASEELLGKSDNESERRCSFTSGSNSTVRHVPSRDNPILLSERRNLIRVCSPSSQDSSSTQHDLSPRLEKSKFSSSVFHHPVEREARRNSSGYESQNTSSETSSHDYKSRDYRKGESTHKWHCDEVVSPHHGLRLSQSCKDFRDHNDQRSNVTTSPPVSMSSFPLEVKTGILPANEFKSREDTSSVDEKYEWDSQNVLELDSSDTSRNWETHNMYITDKMTRHSQTFSEVTYSSDMEKRCAILKKEYHEYRRRMIPVNTIPSTAGSPC